MQLKLLNYYKMLANVAGNLVGAFVPLIIYNATNSLFFACLFLAGIAFCRLLFCLILKKFIQKNPEICLMLRFFTIAAYCTCLNFLHINMIVMCIICIVFLAIDRTFKSLANETLFNYSSGVKVDSKKIGVTRVFEKLGIFLGLIVEVMLSLFKQ